MPGDPKVAGKGVERWEQMPLPAQMPALWTGDNSSHWWQLEQSVATLLGLSVSGVGFCGADIPGFLGRPGSYPIDLEIDPPERQSRLKTLFRIILAIPAFFVSFPLEFLLFVVAFLSWFAALATGRMPTGFRNLGAWALRYVAQTNAYLYLLTDRYPYSGPEAGEPAPEPQPVEPDPWVEPALEAPPA